MGLLSKNVGEGEDPALIFYKGYRGMQRNFEVRTRCQIVNRVRSNQAMCPLIVAGFARNYRKIFDRRKIAALWYDDVRLCSPG